MIDESSGPSGMDGNGAAGGEHDPTRRMQEFAREAEAQVEHARVVFDDINQRALAFIRQRPGMALLGALAVGYVIGKIASRAK